ncbi:MAG: IPT/TIG domain-containing protein [Pyrinomonadaceae bacterium]
MLKSTTRKFKTVALIAICLGLVAYSPNVQRSHATAYDHHVAASLAKSAAYTAIVPQNGGCPPVGFDANAPNLLRNASFEDAGPRGTSASIFGRGGAVDTRSAAADWTMHTSNNSAQVTTALVKSNRPKSGSSMLHITAGSNEGGVYQLFDRDDHGPELVVASVWVFVKRGRVVLATGNEGVTPTASFNGTFGSWEKLTACSDGSSTNNWFVLYSTAVEGSDFYVDQAKVSRLRPAPNPNQCGGMLIEKIVPNITFPGGVIAINGSGFGNRQGTKLPAINRGHVNLLQVTKWTDTQILARSPLDLVGGTYRVLIYCDDSYRTSSNSLEVTVRDDLHRPR